MRKKRELKEYVQEIHERDEYTIPASERLLSKSFVNMPEVEVPGESEPDSHYA